MSNNIISNNKYITPFINEKFSGQMSLHAQLLSFIAHLFNIDIGGILTKEENVEAGNKLFDDILNSLTQTSKNKYSDSQNNLEIIYDNALKIIHMSCYGEDLRFENITDQQWNNLTDYIHKIHPFDKNNYNIESNKLYSADIETEFTDNINENIANLIDHADIDKTIVSDMLENMHKSIKTDNYWKYSKTVNTGEKKHTITFSHSENGLSITCGEKNILIGNDDRRTGYILSHLENKNPTIMDKSGNNKHPSYARDCLFENLKDITRLCYGRPGHEINPENMRKGKLTLDGYQQWFYFINTKEYEYPIIIEYKRSPECLIGDNAHELRIIENSTLAARSTPEKMIKINDPKLLRDISEYLNEITKDEKNLIDFDEQKKYTYSAYVKQGILNGFTEREWEHVYNRWQNQKNVQEAKTEGAKKNEQNDGNNHSINIETNEPLKIERESVRANELDSYLHEYNRLCDEAATDNNPESRDVIISYLKTFINNYSINDIASMGFQVQDLLKVYPLTRDNLIVIGKNLKDRNILEFNKYLPGDRYNGYIDNDYMDRLAMLIWAGFDSNQLKEAGYIDLMLKITDTITLKYLKQKGVTINDFILCYGCDSPYLSPSLWYAGFTTREQISYARFYGDSSFMKNIIESYTTRTQEIISSGFNLLEIKKICDAGNKNVDLRIRFPDDILKHYSLHGYNER